MTRAERAGYRSLERAVGRRQADRLAGMYRDLIRTPTEHLAYRLSGRGRRSRQRLKSLRDAYVGKRCFIIGNGPSLADTPLSALQSEYTFGLNRGYMLFERIGGPTTFLVAVNRHVVEQFGDDIVDAPSTKFVAWRSRRFVPERRDVILVPRSRAHTFSHDVAEQGAWEGATVTYVALQLAFHLGFRQVILVGVDHSFSTKGPPNAAEDPDHFDPNYFGPGVRWELPDLEMSESAYRIARDHFSAHGREVLDATVGGRLEVFPKVSLDAVIGRRI
jgi:hypothetical protein